MITLPQKLSGLSAIMLSLSVLVCVGFIDIFSGHLTIVLLYFLPIGIAAWFAGKKAGILFCFLSVGLWLIDYLRYDYRGWASASWDTAITLGIFVCYSLILSALRDARDGLERFAHQLEQKVIQRTTELKHANNVLVATQEALERRAEQLRNNMIELTHTEERERRRIAQILHDNLQQILVGTKLSVDTLAQHASEPETVRHGLHGIVKLLDEAIQASRSLTSELAPPVLYNKGLPDALRWLARWIGEKYGISVDVNADEGAEGLDENLRVILFQATKELLFNVVKHAHVKRASVALYYGDENMVAASVRDEGVGFDPQAKEGGAESTSGSFGLLTIRERLAAIGGRLKIESAPGCGTASTIYVPYCNQNIVENQQTPATR
jgi:signal transduction histidine kinase